MEELNKILTSESLNKFQQALNKVIDEKKAKAELNEAIESIDKMDFIALKCLFESITDKMYDTKAGQKCIANYIKTIKGTPSLRGMFSLYESINRPSYVQNPELYVNEAIVMGKAFNNAEFNKGCKRMAKIVKEGVKSVGVTANDILSVSENKSPIAESLNYVVGNKKAFSNLSQYVDSVHSLVEHVRQNMLPINESNDVAVKHLMEDLNNSIDNSLSIEERNAVRDIALINISDGNREGLFETYKNKCIGRINESLEDCDSVETKTRFYGMVEQLTEQKYNEQTLNEDILRFARLLDVLAE